MNLGSLGDEAPRTGGILTLDLSGTVGWAYGRPGVMLPLFGTWVLSPSKLLGPRFVSYENELIRALDEYEPRLVVMEAPLPAQGQGTTHVARQQFGLAAYTEGECHRHRVQLREERAGTIRKTMLGRGSFGGTAENKAAVVAWCRAQGWHTSDHNAADALVLWAYACKIESGTARA